MNDKKDGGAVHSQYNLNEATFFLIADLQREAFVLSNRYKNFDGSFNRWQSIRLLISSRFEDKEKEQLDKLEEEFDEQISFIYPKEINNQHQKTKYNHKIYYEVKRKKLNDYVKYLMILMRLYKIGPTDLEKKHRLS